jgi:hypothetical protein
MKLLALLIVSVGGQIRLHLAFWQRPLGPAVQQCAVSLSREVV